MYKEFPRIPAEYIVSLNMNKLRGRMLRMPAPKSKNKEILFVYGHHTSLERMYGMAEVLNSYGAVTMPDLPGFGGMDSFYKISEKPTLDNLADYLASFIKLRYRNRRLTIVGLSFGFTVVTRMLQRYPELANRVDDLVSVGGFSHHEDFSFSKSRMRFYRWGAKFFSYGLTSIFFRNVALHPTLIKSVYTRTHNAKEKFADLDANTFKVSVDFEVHLWRINDLRTHMYTSYEFLRLNNCKQRLNIPVWHVIMPKDRYFDANNVEQHLKVIFSEVTQVTASGQNHSPSIIATKKEADLFFPRKLKLHLSKHK